MNDDIKQKREIERREDEDFERSTRHLGEAAQNIAEHEADAQEKREALGEALRGLFEDQGARLRTRWGLPPR